MKRERVMNDKLRGKKPAQASVGFLLPPADVSAVREGDDVVITFTPIEGATKYSADLESAYDTTGDGQPDATASHDAGGTGSPIRVPVSELALGIDSDGDGVDDVQVAPMSITVKVKSMAPGKGSGRQNSVFSEPVLVS